MRPPKVSVLTPIYNTNPEHLRECIESILNQTFTDFEFLILNDSPDNTELDKIVASYDDKRIKYIKNERNMGISASRNRLLELARGQYLAIFDHDDISMPTRLEKEAAYLDANPDVGVVSGFMEYFDGDTTQSIWKNPEHDLDIKIMMSYDCCVAHSASMIRKSVLVNNNIKYEEYYSPSEDYKLWARLMGVTHFYNIQDIVVRYRNHDARTSVTRCDLMTRQWKTISLEICNQFPVYRIAHMHLDKNGTTTFRLRLFGKIPLIKVKNNWVQLFECIPIFKIKWN